MPTIGNEKLGENVLEAEEGIPVICKNAKEEKDEKTEEDNRQTGKLM